ncbi:putative stress up-regulated Nod 19, partial [Tanacetum coccineum]
VKESLESGGLSSKFDIEFPRGHIAIKSSNAEVVDKAGDLVSLQETYLHNWVKIQAILTIAILRVKIVNLIAIQNIQQVLLNST